MFTANLAGSSGSHLRPVEHYHGGRESRSNSRLNLNDVGGEGADGERTSCREEEGLEEEAWKRRERCFKRAKTVAYLSCVAAIVIGAIVLIILAATGVLSLGSS